MRTEEKGNAARQRGGWLSLLSSPILAAFERSEKAIQSCGAWVAAFERSEKAIQSCGAWVAAFEAPAEKAIQSSTRPAFLVKSPHGRFMMA